MNRREFTLGFTGTALSGSSLAIFSRQANSDSTPTDHRPRHFIYDSRLSAAAHFQHNEPSRDIIVHRFDGDFTLAWYDLIAEIGREGYADIVGITRHSELFIVETLCHQYDYRVTQCEDLVDHCIWRLAPHRLPS